MKPPYTEIKTGEKYRFAIGGYYNESLHVELCDIKADPNISDEELKQSYLVQKDVAARLTAKPNELIEVTAKEWNVLVRLIKYNDPSGAEIQLNRYVKENQKLNLEINDMGGALNALTLEKDKKTKEVANLTFEKDYFKSEARSWKKKYSQILKLIKESQSPTCKSKK